MSLAERVRGLRKRIGWTQKKLADKINVSPQVISNWEREYTTPDVDDIKRLAEVLGTSVDYLLGHAPHTDRGFLFVFPSDSEMEMFTLGQRLRYERAKRGWTIEFVAYELGLKGQTTYSNWEHDSRRPDPEMLARLADLYEVTTDWLIKGEPDPRRVPTGVVESGKVGSFTREIGPDPDHNPLGIQLTNEQLETLRDVLSDPKVMLMFKDFANSTEAERHTMLDVWAAIRRKPGNSDK